MTIKAKTPCAYNHVIIDIKKERKIRLSNKVARTALRDKISICFTRLKDLTREKNGLFQ